MVSEMTVTARELPEIKEKERLKRCFFKRFLKTLNVCYLFIILNRSLHIIHESPKNEYYRR